MFWPSYFQDTFGTASALMSRFCELHTNCCPLYYPTKFGKEVLCDFGDFTNDRNTIEQWLFTVDFEYFVCETGATIEEMTKEILLSTQ